MIQEKQKELEKYLLQEFNIYPTAGQLNALNEICNKAEKDYIFEGEGCEGCKDCDCGIEVFDVPEECRGGFIIKKDIPF